MTVLAADLSQLNSEANLEKRSDLALNLANQALDDAKKAYEESPQAFPGHIRDMKEAVELSYRALEDTGKAARRNPKYFKRAELRLRALLKRLDNLEHEISSEDREPVNAAKKRIGEVHEQILFEIMSKK